LLHGFAHQGGRQKGIEELGKEGDHLELERGRRGHAAVLLALWRRSE
jgi:hypothetical protein